MQLKLSYTHHLVSLVADTAALAGRLADLPEAQREPLRQAARRESARLSARLDGSPLQPETASAVDRGDWERPAALPQAGSTERAGGWASALRLDAMDTEDLAAIEYDNLCRTYDAEPELAEQLFDRPLDTLARLHGAICERLVEPEVIGRPRRTEQAVHDGAQGMVIFNAPDHETLPTLLEQLQRWLRGDSAEGSAAYPAPVVAAVVHERLLQWQPFEAGNGRVARAAARLVLRARGFDVHGLAVPERHWAADPAGYYQEVAATLRRREDMGPWVERHLETLHTALLDAVQAARPALREPSTRALALLEQLDSGEAITVSEYAGRAGISRESAGRDLRELRIAGHLIGEPKSLGRRFRRP